MFYVNFLKCIERRLYLINTLTPTAQSLAKYYRARGGRVLTALPVTTFLLIEPTFNLVKQCVPATVNIEKARNRSLYSQRQPIFQRQFGDGCSGEISE